MRESNVTRESIGEYAAAVRDRYRSARKRERTTILDEFCATTGYHRKAAIRLLARSPHPAGSKRGRPRVYGLAVTQALKVVWEASDHLSSKLLAPFLPTLIPRLEQLGALTVTDEVRTALLAMRPTTIDERLKPYRRTGLRRPYSPSRAATSLRAQIPLRTFGDWAGVTPGSLQADLVLHCGDTLLGFYLTTLTTVDVATGWTECRVVWGKNQDRVQGAIHRIRQQLPMALRELHTDNGSEFINECLFPYCRREGIQFTRGRPYRKNDQAWVEQKNWAAVRRLVGYNRYSTQAAYALLVQFYDLHRLYVNFFQPVRKLVSKERVGPKVVKRFDTAATPYQRLLRSGVLGATAARDLELLERHLNPLKLRSAMLAIQQELHAERELPATSRAAQRAAATAASTGESS
jgi:hypothetical protein